MKGRVCPGNKFRNSLLEVLTNGESARARKQCYPVFTVPKNALMICFYLVKSFLSRCYGNVQKFPDKWLNIQPVTLNDPKARVRFTITIFTIIIIISTILQISSYSISCFSRGPQAKRTKLQRLLH